MFSWVAPFQSAAEGKKQRSALKASNNHSVFSPEEKKTLSCVWRLNIKCSPAVIDLFLFLPIMFPVYNLWFLQHEVEDAIFCLQPCFYALQKRPAVMHPPPLFSPSVHHCVSRLCTGRQLVQKQASCPPPQTQRWRNWAPSTLSSCSSTLNVSTDREAGGRAGRQPSQRLTPPPPPLPLPPTHTLIYTRSWFFISRGASRVSQCFSQACTSFVFLRLIYIHHVTTRERVWAERSENEWHGVQQCVRSARLSLRNLCVFAHRLQPEGKGRSEGIWCRWQSGSAQTRRGEGTECPALHHQVHFSNTPKHTVGH